MICISVEIIFYWAWIIISVWENEAKLKETTVNYLAIGVYTREHSESVKQYARIVWAFFNFFTFGFSCFMIVLRLEILDVFSDIFCELIQ